MRDPYEVLGVARTASADQVKSAYRALAKKYHPDNYADSPLQEVANEKMQEINEAYDAIISGNADAGRSSYNQNNAYSNYNYGGYSNSYSSGYSNSTVNDYSYIRNLIDNSRLDDAEILLENMSVSSRDAQWYYLKGRINYNRGWIDQAYDYFSTAYRMDPNNDEYRNIYENLSNQRSGGFRSSRRNNDSDCCEILSCLCCADQCCDCMGGDLIPCC